ncbi:MAG: guanylate kinase [Verrucomicrobia bacterium]|nr:guanylate kinase [Verrucomicrobiota bacterium]
MKPAAPAEHRMPLLVALSAPSGAGKTTLGQELLGWRPNFTRVVTCTTRAPREGEVNGEAYHFLSHAEFEQRIAQGDFLEHALVYSQRYGTLRSDVIRMLRSGRDVLLTLDVQGVQSIQRLASSDPELKRSLVTVFLTPPGISELERRLAKRGQNNADDLERRLAEARREIGCWADFDYLIVSASIQEDARRMLAIVDAESIRSNRMSPPTL